MNEGICPVCNGTGRRAVEAHNQRYKFITAGYDPATDTLACNNCGGQHQYGRPTGRVPLNRAGEPCRHSYTSRTVGRCLTEYTCSDCGHSYTIDSGD